MVVWAFNWVSDEKSKQVPDEARKLVYKSIKSGKSRFGWSQKDEHDLSKEDNWDLLPEEERKEWYSNQRFLLQIKPGDWIVHINTPEWDKCIAAEVASEYDFDDGLQLSDRTDFRHYFNVKIDTIVEFNRKDPNVLPSVNLKPRYRYQRVYAVDDFHQSIENLKSNIVDLDEGESRNEFFLKDKTEEHLSKMSELIHEMYKGKDLEGFLAEVFRKIPGVVDVEEMAAEGEPIMVLT